MVSTQGALGAAATLVAIAFALSTLDRWVARRRRHELAWTISLLMFATAAAALWWGAATGWGEASFRVFFLFGAILNVPWLALGTVYLLGGVRQGDRVAAGLAVASAFAAGVLVVAPMTAPVPEAGLPAGSDLFGPLPRIMAAVGSGVGAIVLIGGALLSAWRLLRGRPRVSASPAPDASPKRLALGNLLIALGALILSGSGTLAGRLGELEAFEVTLLAGISVLFVGFLVTTSKPAGGVAPPRAAGPRVEQLVGPASAQDAPQDLAAHPAG